MTKSDSPGSPRITILVVEDDEAIRRGVTDALRFEGYEVLVAGDGTEGLSMSLEANYDLLLLDLVLPGRAGLEILQELRRVRPITPVIILTALGQEADRVRGLRVGADDYVVKPFGVQELMARVQAVLRRSPERPVDLKTFDFRDGVADFERREVRYLDGSRTELSQKESEVLRYLVQNPGRAISRQELLHRVWQLPPNGIETRTIDMHIARIRDKLRDNNGSQSLIMTVRGRGYMLAAGERL